MGCLGLFILLIIVLPAVLVLLFLQVVTISFTKLGLSPEAALVLLVASLVGSMINIPLSRRRVTWEEPRSSPFPFSLFFYTPPPVREQILAVNLGGAVIPVMFSMYLLLGGAPLWQTGVAVVVVAGVAKWLARPRRGVGIVMPLWIPPLASVAMALVLAPHNAAPVAYIAGTMGTLIGADLLNYRSFRRLGAHMLSIGGAGVFDGIFLVGIAAALLA